MKITAWTLKDKETNTFSFTDNFKGVELPMVFPSRNLARNAKMENEKVVKLEYNVNIKEVK